MKERINICFASDNNYAPYMGMALFSVLRNAGAEETFHFYILDMGISEENKQKIASLNNTHEFDITYIPIDRSRLSGCDPKKLSLATFGRFFIPELIPQDKVLYLDCDIMVRASLLPMWKTDLAGFYLAGVPDVGAIFRGCLQERFGGKTEFVKNFCSILLSMLKNLPTRTKMLLTLSAVPIKKCCRKDGICLGIITSRIYLFIYLFFLV